MQSPYASVALIAVLVLLMYFVVMRPQRRRQQQQQQTLRTIEPGTRVMLTSGIFATVTQVGEKQMVVQTGPGAELTVLKQAVSKVVPEGDEDAPGVLSGQGYEPEADTEAYDPAQPSYPGQPTYQDQPIETYGSNANNADSADNGSGSSEPVWPPTPGQQSTSADPNVWASGTENSDRASSSLGDSSLTSGAFDQADGGEQSGWPSTESGQSGSSAKE